MRPHIEGLAVGLVLAFAAVSAWVWVTVVRAWRRHAEVLPFVPRRPVPWGPVGLLVAGFFLLDKLLGLLGGEVRELPPEEATRALMQWTAFEVLATLAGVMLLRSVSRAGWHDLGFPGTVREGAEDALLGLFACLASLGPVYLLLYFFIWIFGPIPQHPLLEDLLEEPSVALLTATAVSAVIGAPIFEEFVYRLLVQGWLEKVLMPGAAFSDGTDTPDGTGDTAAPDAPTPSGKAPVYDESQPEGDRPAGSNAPPGESKTVWLPIVISSLLFATAHLGYGYSPVPLFLLGLILGYVYQRTHRILPCVVAHMAFNGLSVAMAGLETFGNPPVPN